MMPGDQPRRCAPLHQVDIVSSAPGTSFLNVLTITVLGATGGVGTHLVRQAIAAGHSVVALARSPKVTSEAELV